MPDCEDCYREVSSDAPHGSQTDTLTNSYYVEQDGGKTYYCAGCHE